MDNGEIPRNTYERRTNKIDSVDNLSMAKVDSLKEAISEITSQIDERKAISSLFDKEGDKMKMNISNFLHQSTPQGDDDSEFARERAELRKKSIEINEMQLQEKVNCWRDIVTLKKDLRDSRKELFERESRIDTINKILEGN